MPQLESAAQQNVTGDGGTARDTEDPQAGKSQGRELWIPLLGAGKAPQAELSSGSDHRITASITGAALNTCCKVSSR